MLHPYRSFSRKPLKAAITAAFEHFADLLPFHLAYSHAHEIATEDWICSTGCNPFSITSRGWRLSQFHLDTIARSYIITSLEESIQLVNSAIHRLTLEQTSILFFYCQFFYLPLLGINEEKIAYGNKVIRS